MLVCICMRMCAIVMYVYVCARVPVCMHACPRLCASVSVWVYTYLCMRACLIQSIDTV